MAQHVANLTISVRLNPSECQTLYRAAQRRLDGDEFAAGLIEQLGEAATLSIWLRDVVRLELSPADAALLEDLRRNVANSPSRSGRREDGFSQLASLA